MTTSGHTPVDFSAERLAGIATFEHLVAAVQACIDAGRFHPGLDAWLVATGLWVTVHGITSLLISRPDFPWPPAAELIEHALSTVTLGLTSPTTEQTRPVPGTKPRDRKRVTPARATR